MKKTLLFVAGGIILVGGGYLVFKKMKPSEDKQTGIGKADDKPEFEPDTASAKQSIPDFTKGNSAAQSVVRANLYVKNIKRTQGPNANPVLAAREMKATLITTYPQDIFILKSISGKPVLVYGGRKSTFSTATI